MIKLMKTCKSYATNNCACGLIPHFLTPSIIRQIFNSAEGNVTQRAAGPAAAPDVAARHVTYLEKEIDK